ncbi:MAG: hypothetical protein WAX79_03950 [Candidatus Omnitrophota bacterium]
MRISYKIFALIILLSNLLIIFYFYFFSYQGYLEGAPGWILAVIGAPMTFLTFPVFRAAPKFLSGIFSQYLFVSLLLQLQYQLIGYFLFQIRFKKNFIKILIFTLIIVSIFISAKKMRKIVMPSLDEITEMSEQQAESRIGVRSLQLTVGEFRGHN